MIEKYLNIIDFKDYQISNFGNIKSKITGQILKKILHNKSKDLYIFLHKDKKTYYFNVSKLVAKHFIPNPNNYTKILFKDKNRYNLKHSNIQWIPNKIIKKTKEDKIDSNSIVQLKNNKLIKIWKNKNEINKYSNTLYYNVCHCLSKRRKTAMGYKWFSFKEYFSLKSNT